MLAVAAAALMSALRLLLQQPGPANNWTVCSPSAAGGLQPPDDWEIDISQLHIDSKVRQGRSGAGALAQPPLRQQQPQSAGSSSSRHSRPRGSPACVPWVVHETLTIHPQAQRGPAPCVAVSCMQPVLVC